MAFLKKVSEDWKPDEKPNLKVGEMFDFPGPYETLVRSGMAILVDKKGNEIELPGQMFECPVCFEEVEGLQGFIDHVSKHMPNPKVDFKAKKKAEAEHAKRLAEERKAEKKRLAKNKAVKAEKEAIKEAAAKGK